MWVGENAPKSIPTSSLKKCHSYKQLSLAPHTFKSPSIVTHYIKLYPIPSILSNRLLQQKPHLKSFRHLQLLLVSFCNTPIISRKSQTYIYFLDKPLSAGIPKNKYTRLFYNKESCNKECKNRTDLIPLQSTTVHNIIQNAILERKYKHRYAIGSRLTVLSYKLPIQTVCAMDWYVCAENCLRVSLQLHKISMSNI